MSCIVVGRDNRQTWKNRISCYPSIRQGQKKRLVTDILDFKELGLSYIYLSNSLVMRRNETNEFGLLKEKAKWRLQSLIRKLLSKLGKMMLIREVFQAILTYTVSTFKVPFEVCKAFDIAVKQLWWLSNTCSSRFLSLMAWSDLCKPKVLGGLGFRWFTNINSALVSKLAWRICRGDDTLWAQVIGTKYLWDGAFFNVSWRMGPFMCG